MSSKASAESEEVRVEIVESGPVQRTLQVEVEAVRVRKAFDRAYHQLGRSAQVRGFRRGKVPRSVLEKLYGASVAEDLERSLVAETLPDAIELAQVTPISEPEIEGEKPSVDRSFRYTARIEIKPIIELPELTGLPATLTRAGVADEDVERELAGLRDRNAPLLEEPEGTPVAEGHHVEVDFQGRIDGEPFEGGSGKDVVIEIGTNRMIPGFEEQLVGARPGEAREVRVQFPDDYQSEALRGKEALFTVQLKTLRRKQLPDLDDEFAKDLGPFESLENLRERIRTDLLAARQREAQAALHRSLLDVLIERTSFEVPPGLVERRLHSQLASRRRVGQRRSVGCANRCCSRRWPRARRSRPAMTPWTHASHRWPRSRASTPPSFASWRLNRTGGTRSAPSWSSAGRLIFLPARLKSKKRRILRACPAHSRPVRSGRHPRVARRRRPVDGWQVAVGSRTGSRTGSRSGRAIQGCSDQAPPTGAPVQKRSAAMTRDAPEGRAGRVVLRLPAA